MLQQLKDELFSLETGKLSFLQLYYHRSLKIQQGPNNRKLIWIMKFIELMLVINSIRYLVYYLPIKSDQRILLFDPCYLFKLDPNLHVNSFLANLSTMFNFHQLYFVGHPVIRKFFAKHLFPTADINAEVDVYRHKSVARTRIAINVLLILSIIIAIFTLYCHYSVIEQVIVDRPLFGELFQPIGIDWFLTLARLIWMEFNCLMHCLTFWSIFYIVKVGCGMAVFTTSLVFGECARIKSMLDDHPPMPLNGRLLYEFFHQHHQIFEVVMRFNQTYSSVLLSLFLTAWPITLYINATWLVGHHHQPSQSSPSSSQKPAELVTIDHSKLVLILAIAANITVLCVLTFFHYIFALFTKHLHNCVTPRLLIINARYLKGRFRLALQLKVVNYIEKFHTTKPYGLTYHQFGLITMQTFFAFLLIYGKCLMKLYKLFSNP